MEKRLVLKKATRLTTGARSCTSAPAKTGFPLTSSPYVCEEYRSDYELSVDQGRVDGSSIEILNDSRIPVKGRALCSFTLSSVEECPRVAGRHSLRITFQFVRRSNVAESSALDGGPPFRIGQVVGVSFGKENTMEQKDGDERKDAQGDLSESSSDSDTDRDDESPFFVVKRPSHLSPGRQKLHFSLVFRRFYTRVQWAAVSSQNPHIIHLLEGAEEDGDVLLMGKDGSKTAAHSALLIKVPYFRRLLSKSWGGSYNFDSKRECDLPVEVSEAAVKAFLRCLYGQLPAFEIQNIDDATKQELLSLAEALNRYDVCKALLEDLGAITSANVDWWMSWLGKEHNVVLNLDPIRIKLGQFFKLRLFSGAGFYACLNDEVLLALQAATKKLEEHEASSRALKRSRKL